MKKIVIAVLLSMGIAIFCGGCISFCNHEYRDCCNNCKREWTDVNDRSLCIDGCFEEKLNCDIYHHR